MISCIDQIMNGRFTLYWGDDMTRAERITMVAIIVAMFILLFFCSRGQCATYYLSASGDNSGSSTNCAGAMDMSDFNDASFSPDDVIKVCDDDGVFRSQMTVPSSGTSGHPITIEAETGDTPIISGADLITTWIWDDPNTNVWMSALATSTEIVCMDDSRGTEESTKAGLNTALEWFHDGTTSLYVYAASDPDSLYTSPGIEAGRRSHAIDGATRDYIKLDGLTLQITNIETVDLDNQEIGWEINDCVFKNSPSSLILLNGTDPTSITSSSFSGAGGDSIYGWQPDNTTITDCTFTTVFGSNADHIHFYDGNDITIQRNDFDMNGSITSKGCVILTSWTTALIEYNETAYGNYGFDLNGSGIVCRYNVSHDHTGETWSSGIYSAQDADVHSGMDVSYNIIYDCVMGIYMWGDQTRTNHNFYNNVIYNCSSRGVQFGSSANSISGNFKNNIIWCSGATHAYRINNVGTWVSESNLIGPEGANFIYWDDTTGYATLAAFVAGESQDANSPTPSDPLFVDAENGDFSLRPGSPCINAGTDLGDNYKYAFDPRDKTFPYDLYDQNLYPPWDIGAYVYKTNRFWLYIKYGIF